MTCHSRLPTNDSVFHVTSGLGRIVQLLKNIIRVGGYFFKVLGVDIQVVNMDQMPLHRNETARSKSLNIKNTVS